MRVAFFGGSFDPPHRGHLAIARAARDRLSLDRVLLAPVGLQPLKRVMSAASFPERLAMLHLLADGEPGIEVSELDAPRPDGVPNYSFDTLTRLRAQLGLAAHLSDDRPDSLDHDGVGSGGDARSADLELFMLVGADSFLMMQQWHRADELMMLCDWIVAGRPGFALDEAARALPAGIVLQGEARLHEAYTEQVLGNAAGRRSVLYLLTDLREDVSATEIRAAIAGADSSRAEELADGVLPPEVREYIHTHQLYR